MQLDTTDQSILRILQKDALATLKDISTSVNLSVSPTHDRIKRMETEGVIQKYVALIDRKKIELGMVVFCHVTLDKQTKNNFSEFEQTILQFDEVVACSLVSGSFDYYLKVVSKDVETYKKHFNKKCYNETFDAQLHGQYI